MKVLIACEFSGVVREAFRKRGHDAWSCDLLPTEKESKYHIQDNVLNHLNDGWDLMIAHPPCQFLSNAGIGWFNEERYGDKARYRKQKRIEALNFVEFLFNSKIEKICVENPTGYLNSHFAKPTQIIQPYYFGDMESKRTCLWLKNLPLLTHIKIVKPKIYGYYKTGVKKGQPIYGNSWQKRSADRWKERSRTFQGVADAMADQWGMLLTIGESSNHG